MLNNGRSRYTVRDLGEDRELHGGWIDYELLKVPKEYAQ